MLNINGQEYEEKFNYKFNQRLVDDYSTDDVDGFSRLINQLIDSDPDGLVAGYRYSLDTKKLPSSDEVAEALAAQGVFDDEDPFGDLFKKIKADGFLAMRLKHLIVTQKNSLKTVQKLLPILQKSGTKKEIAEGESEIKAGQAGVALLEEQFERLSN